MTIGDYVLHIPSIGHRFRYGSPCRVLEIRGAAATVAVAVRDVSGELVKRTVPKSSLVLAEGEDLERVLNQFAKVEA